MRAARLRSGAREPLAAEGLHADDRAHPERLALQAAYLDAHPQVEVLSCRVAGFPAGQVRQGFYGQEAQRIQRGRDEIRVWVRYTDQDLASL